MNKSKEELLAYSLKILQRGDSWRAVQNYLGRQAPPEIASAVMVDLQKMDRENLIGPPPAEPASGLDLNIILGTILIGGGIIMAIVLWDMGFISTIPFIIIAGGIWGMAKGNERRSSGKPM